MKKLLLILTFICLKSSGFGQSVKDSSIQVLMTGLHFSIQQPQFDLNKRFGNNLNVGIPIWFKMKNNFVFGMQANYFFGNSVKEDIIKSFRNEDGTIINNTGVPATIRIFERGLSIFGELGKIFPTSKKNKNTGIITMIGFGYLQHKIKFYNPARDVAQLAGTKYKGYDRLSGGPAARFFLGYFYLSKNKLANFYFGMECIYGYTQGIRGYQYDLMNEDNAKRNDALLGINLGWVLPFYKRTPQEFYYN